MIYFALARAIAPLRVCTRSATGSQGIRSDLRFSLDVYNTHDL
eukprot:UN02030